MKLALSLAGLIAFSIAHMPAWALGDHECDPGGKQSQMNACAKDRFEAADRDLNRVYRELMGSLAEPERKTLLHEQRSWLRSRDPKCREEANNEAEGGSTWPMVYDDCRTTVTKARVKVLENWRQPGAKHN